MAEKKKILRSFGELRKVLAEEAFQETTRDRETKPVASSGEVNLSLADKAKEEKKRLAVQRSKAALLQIRANEEQKTRDLRTLRAGNSMKVDDKPVRPPKTNKKRNKGKDWDEGFE